MFKLQVLAIWTDFMTCGDNIRLNELKDTYFWLTTITLIEKIKLMLKSISLRDLKYFCPTFSHFVIIRMYPYVQK